MAQTVNPNRRRVPLSALSPPQKMSFRSNSNHIQLLQLELAKQTHNHDLARLKLAKGNHHITTFQKKLQRLQVLIDQVVQDEQEARAQLKVDIDHCTALGELVKSIEQKIRSQ